MSGSFAWLCIYILDGGHFSFPDAYADPVLVGLALRPTLSTDMIQRVLLWERQKMKTTEDNTIVKLDFLIFFFKVALFGHILEKSTHPLLVHCHSPWSIFAWHLVRGPKALHIEFSKKLDHWERPSSMVQLHGPWCKLALELPYTK